MRKPLKWYYFLLQSLSLQQEWEMMQFELLWENCTLKLKMMIEVKYTGYL